MSEGGLFRNLVRLKLASQRVCKQVPWVTHNNGMLQDLPLSGHHMRMDNDLWPVVRESARRVLRLENILFRTPKKFDEDFTKLCDEISEYIPSRLIFPEIEYVESSSVEILHKNSSSTEYEKIIEIGNFEPNAEVCWIECDLDEGWKWLIESCLELLAAGYPGCTGCGGPNSEKRWDEEKFRKNRKSAS